jgi:hypothetical protein
MKDELPPIVTPAWPVFLVLLCGLLSLVGIGCHSMSGPASASFASVIIHNHSPAEIQKVTIQVFQEDGYAVGSIGDQMVFQKEGSRMTNLAYEGAVGSYYGAQTIVRVKTDLVPLGNDSYRLQCQAYIVRNAGDAFFADEQKLANIRSGPYRSLLKKVAKQLN